MRSRHGFWAAVVFLASIPAALLVEISFGGWAETVLHFAFAAGSALLALAAFDFQMPRPLQVAGAIAVGALAVVFFLQGLGNLTQNEALNRVAFDILGQWTERLLTDALLLLLASILIFASRGRTRILGLITVGGAFAVESYNYWLNYHGTTINAEFPLLKIILLTPFLWLLLESGKSRSQ